jgi:predicted nucleic acid-binding protein
MITALDTNVIIALLKADNALSLRVQQCLDTAQGRGRLVISAPVFAELMAAPGPDESFLDSFFRHTGIAVEWELQEAIWRLAGQAFHDYAERRRRQRDPGARRILADFLTGAHASHHGYHLLTLDERIYKAAFPELAIITI